MTATTHTGNNNNNNKPPNSLVKLSKRIRYSPTFVAACIVAVIILFIIYYALLDRYTPMTSGGYVQANVTQVAPQVDRIVTVVHVKDNEQVKAGTLLFEVDSRPYAFAVNQLQAELVLAHKEVAHLEKDLDLANDTINEVQADLTFAQTEFDRYSKAARKGASPVIQVDAAKGTGSARAAPACNKPRPTVTRPRKTWPPRLAISTRSSQKRTQS